MDEKGSSNRGDDVNEELPHTPDTAGDGRCCLETEFFFKLFLPPLQSVSSIKLLS